MHLCRRSREAAIHEPISLGFSCEVKYQLSRWLFLRKFPGGSQFDFRRMLLGHALGQRNFDRHLFDWQITPFEAALAYLERDFRNVFERDDLRVVEGEAEHRSLLARHPHAFHAEGGVLDDAVIYRQYPDARDKFEHLAAKFRRLLDQPGPYLYVARTTPCREDAVRLRRLLQRRNPGHRFDLLFVGWEDGAALPDLTGVAHYAWAALESGKSAGREWEGDDEAWDAVLSPWDLGVHGGGIAPRYEPGTDAEAEA